MDPLENPEETAVDDVRRVRERIARQHDGDLQGHIDETNRIAAELLKKLNIRVVPAPTKPVRDGTGG
jgi:hypothetical protein